MKKLRELSIDLNESINKLKIIVEEANKREEKLKIFINIRNVINNMED